MLHQKSIYTVIMAGGIGSRFWPQSTPSRPKQFLDILNEGVTMIQQTVRRAEAFCDMSNIFVVTSHAYRPLVAEQLPELADNQIMGEPCMRNTAPCIAWAVWKIRQIDADACILVVPSDSFIPDTEAFTRDIISGLHHVSLAPAIMTLGIQPTGPETGYGYIEAGASVADGATTDIFAEAGTCTSTSVCDETGILTEATTGTIYSVAAFREKPTADKAREYLTQGNFLWNAGIFMASADTFVDAFRLHLPEMAQQFDSGNAAYNTPAEQAFIDEMFPRCTSISMDYGIMEKATNIRVMAATFRWSDVGAWNAVYELQRKDENGNTFYDGAGSRKVIYEGVANCLVSVPEGTLAVIEGVSDLIIVQSGNRLLVCTKANEQRIKEFVGKF